MAALDWNIRLPGLVGRGGEGANRYFQANVGHYQALVEALDLGWGRRYQEDEGDRDIRRLGASPVVLL